jgi:hypothetical protein
MLATEVVLLLQLPSPAPLNAVVLPTQTPAVPVIAPGRALTVTITVPKHPVPDVYVIVVVPADSPYTKPVPEPTVATVVLLLDHIPPPVAALLSVVLAPTHTDNEPENSDGALFTVTTAVA